MNKDEFLSVILPVAFNYYMRKDEIKFNNTGPPP